MGSNCTSKYLSELLHWRATTFCMSLNRFWDQNLVLDLNCHLLLILVVCQLPVQFILHYHRPYRHVITHITTATKDIYGHFRSK